MAEESAVGKFHVVDNAEADDVIVVSEHAILHNEMIGRVLRNMYGRIQHLEKELAVSRGLETEKLKAVKPKRSGSP